MNNRWGALNRLLRSSANMMPHSGVGGWAPRPRKESAAAEMMAVPIPSVPCTIRGVIAFGKMRRKRMRRGRHAQRPIRGHEIRFLDGDHAGSRDAGITRDRYDADGQKRVDQSGTQNRDEKNGQEQKWKGSITSMTRMVTLSIQPPRYPDTAPRIVPTVNASDTVANPMISDRRAPKSIRLKKSRLLPSMPKMCCGPTVRTAEQVNAGWGVALRAR